MLTIDGSFGEGGGQILRSSLSLSMVTGTPFRIEKIRAGRKKPGLLRQHLTAVRAAAEICAANVEGDEIGSTALTFKPGTVKGGEYHFAIGTAGSTTLVLQTLLLPLALADRASRITLEGGTHNPHAPPYDFLAKAFLPQFNRLGPRVEVALERHGFYPAGGGRIVADIQPTTRLSGFMLMERGEIKARHARALVANLPRHIAERELRAIQRKLNWDERWLEVEKVQGSAGPGNVLFLEITCENVTEVFTAFGDVGRPAEAVGRDAAEQCRRYLAVKAPVGEFLTDQLMLPLAVAGSGGFVSIGLSLHAQTHLELIGQFLRVGIRKADRGAEGIELMFGESGPPSSSSPPMGLSRAHPASI